MIGEVQQLQNGDSDKVLSERERQILTHLANGDNNKQIAKQLNISERTVCFHLANFFVKLGVSNRMQAVTFAINHVLINVGYNVGLVAEGIEITTMQPLFGADCMRICPSSRAILSRKLTKPSPLFNVGLRCFLGLKPMPFSLICRRMRLFLLLISCE